MPKTPTGAARDDAFAGILEQLDTLGRRRRRRPGPRPAWEWFDADVRAALRAPSDEAHPIHGRYAIRTVPAPRFLPATKLPHPYNRQARAFPGTYRHQIEAVPDLVTHAYWARHHLLAEVPQLAGDLRDAIEEGLTVMARRFLARGRRRKDSTADRLKALHATYAHGGPFDVLRHELVQSVRRSNRAITWLSELAALPKKPPHREPMRPAAFSAAAWLAAHHPEHRLVYPDVVMLLLAGRWDREHLLEQDTDPETLVRMAVEHEAKDLAGHGLDHTALVKFLGSFF
jgi:hypothetical protein